MTECYTVLDGWVEVEYDDDTGDIVRATRGYKDKILGEIGPFHDNKTAIVMGWLASAN